MPLSQVSATASLSMCCSIRSAIRSKAFDRSAAEVLPHASAAACAASSAFSISGAVPRATRVNTLPSIGEAFSKYWPSAGATHSPPMKLSYLGAKVTALPSVPGAAYFAIACSCR
ncbi:Uncharacterised protein [Mycobacteroides abscessus subsp. abscessus]|nr:Uncharacterised protein [Mycobacteroides abscessus subsp. abscessus]